MNYVGEELQRLAALLDRGVLTRQEFDQQKALLLNPRDSTPPVALAPADPFVSPPPEPAASSLSPPPQSLPAAAPQIAFPPSASNKGPLIVFGVLGVLIAALLVLWATGTLAKWGLLNSPGLSSHSSVNASTATTNPFGLPTTAPTKAPIPAPMPSLTPNAEIAGTNPLIGEWVHQGMQTDTCPQTVGFAASTVAMSGTKNGVPQQQSVSVTYVVQSPETVIVTANGDAATARISGSSMTLDNCTYTRAG